MTRAVLRLQRCKGTRSRSELRHATIVSRADGRAAPTRIISSHSMSDEASRSAHSSGQRRSDGAPAWWAALDRVDLPEDAASRPQSLWFDDELTGGPLRQVAGIEDIPSPRRAWLINVVAILVAVVVIMLGVGVDSPRSALVVGLLFGVPVVLVAITAAVAARRSRG